ncbi:MAG TPA: aldehyde dehydrogenase family protein [Kineosporiaceae bacterium]|nr:aldehyde dehydrogenase family protein [Kineosporiaceae bacterium]
MSTTTDTTTSITDAVPDPGPAPAPGTILGPGTLLGERPAMRIGDRWVTTDETRDVENPATGEIVTAVPEATQEHVDQVLAAAAAAQKSWARLTLGERAEVIGAVIREVDRHAEELARIVVAEQGKTITEARGEMGGVKAFLDFAFAQRYRQVGEVVAAANRQEQLLVREEPYGVVVAIIPWNFPAAIFARKVGPALMAGNAIVLKPSEVTPLAPLALARVCELAGVPAGLVNVVTGVGRTVGKALVEHPATGMVTVTGSTRAGREILAQAADKVIPVSLELGGKAPFVVFQDADVELAARRAVEARLWNCGQVCTCNERTYVHRSVHDAFVERVTELMREVRVGDPLDEASQMGPKVSGAEWEKVKGYVDRAVEQGAQVVLGGGRPEGEQYARGHWFAPTVLTGVRNDMEIVQNEVFGPVLPVVPFDGYDEVVEYANSTVYGLTAYVFTRDVATAMRVTDDLEFGEVYVNTIGPEQVQGFHTGWKLSGLGGDDGQHGFERYLRRKTVYLGYGE